MKTISSTDDAFSRLSEWQESPDESLSRVILKTVPQKGTLADLAKLVDRLPVLTDEQYQKLNKVIEHYRNPASFPDPWTAS